MRPYLKSVFTLARMNPLAEAILPHEGEREFGNGKCNRGTHGLEAELPPNVADFVLIGRIVVPGIRPERGSRANQPATMSFVDFALHLRHGFELLVGRIDQAQLPRSAAQVGGHDVHMGGDLAGPIGTPEAPLGRVQEDIESVGRDRESDRASRGIGIVIGQHHGES